MQSAPTWRRGGSASTAADPPRTGPCAGSILCSTAELVEAERGGRHTHVLQGGPPREARPVWRCVWGIGVGPAPPARGARDGLPSGAAALEADRPTLVSRGVVFTSLESCTLLFLIFWALSSPNAIICLKPAFLWFLHLKILFP